ncbi:MAG: uroporphyrinogen-III C-methyltransferase [Chloroflexota bacterium]|nr:uroporphyrinogen-III C-methyltransferase [Chloroflexota bacterium]
MSIRLQPRTGFVSLVGAGPGDPELLTLKGLRRLEEADAVVHDRLVPRELLGYCRTGAELYDVGKAPGLPSPTQLEINALLVRLGLDGQRVVRLKGGDPFVFGRGGEEALALAEAGVPFEIVPGVSSALAAPAAAGIPVTHRGVAGAVTIATGHERAGAPDGGTHDWEALARTRGTLVFLMAVEHLETIVESLLEHGRAPDEPAALVRQGTTEEQTLLTGPLKEIHTLALASGLTPPAVLVVGPTVGLAGALGAQLSSPSEEAGGQPASIHTASTAA